MAKNRRTHGNRSTRCARRPKDNDAKHVKASPLPRHSNNPRSQNDGKQDGKNGTDHTAALHDDLLAKVHLCRDGSPRLSGNGKASVTVQISRRMQATNECGKANVRAGAVEKISDEIRA